MDYIVADKGYYFNDFAEIIEAADAKAVIPLRSNCKQQQPYDKHIYKARNLS